MLVVVVSAGRNARKRDISEYQGAGWSKGADGYSYDIPKTNLDSVESYYEDAGCINGGFGEFCCINGAGNPNCEIASQEPIATPYKTQEIVPLYTEPTYTAGGDYEVTNEFFAPIEEDYLPPSEDFFREYLPPILRRRLRRVQKRRLRFAKRQ